MAIAAFLQLITYTNMISLFQGHIDVLRRRSIFIFFYVFSTSFVFGAASMPQPFHEPFRFRCIAEISSESWFFWAILIAAPVALTLLFVLFWFGTMRYLIKRRTEQLKESQENMRITLNSIGDAVITTDPEGRVNSMNPVAETLTGWSEEEAKHHKLEEVFQISNSETGAIVENPVQKVVTNGNIVGLANHTKLKSKKGAQFQISDSAAPIKDSSGKIIGVVLIFRDVTEDYHLQKQVAESETRLRALYESMSEGLCLHELVYDETGNAVNYRILDVNPRYETILGLQADQVVGRLATEVYGTEEPPYFDTYCEVARTGKPINTEVFFEPMQKHFSINVFSPGQGQFATIFTDITQQKTSEEKVRLHAQRFEGLFGSLNDAVFVHPWNEVGFKPFVEVNNIACKRYGYTREEFLKLTAEDITMSTDVKYHGTKDFRTYVRDRKHVVMETEHLKKNGETFPVEINSNVVELSGQKVIVAVVRDISERKRREQRLLSLNKVLRSIRDVNQLITREKDRGRMITEATRIMVRTRGFYHCWIHLLQQEDRDALFAVSPSESKIAAIPATEFSVKQLRCMESADYEKGVVVVKCPSEECPGCEFADQYEGHSSICAPLIFGGRHYGYLSAAMETDSFLEEEDEKSLFREIAKDLAYALNSLDIEEQDNRNRLELIAAKEEAEAANNAKNEFLAMMSHEMRTPLNPIMGFTSLLLNEPVEEPHRSYYEAIMNSAKRELNLIDKILNYTRLDRRTFEPRWSEFTIGDLCKDALRDIEKSSHGLALHIQLDESHELMRESLLIRSDKNMLLQILDNLLDNACKYTPDGSVTLEAALLKTGVEGKKGLFEFSVTDTGIGLEKGMLSRIFNPFTQVDGSYTREFEGAGLGLSICKKLTDYLGGEIGVESEARAGSRFWVRLPLEILEETTPEPNTIKSEHQYHFEQPWRVLIVEDKEDNLAITQELLKVFKLRYNVARNGVEAIEICARLKFNLILMDLSMPRMDGFEATIAIRASNGLNRHTPIIAITADATADTRRRCSDAGMDNYVAKPVLLDDLYHAIRDTLMT